MDVGRGRLDVTMSVTTKRRMFAFVIRSPLGIAAHSEVLPPTRAPRAPQRGSR
jgi:hypothetical protein